MLCYGLLNHFFYCLNHMFWSEMQGMQPCTVAQVPRCRELQPGLGRLSQWRRLRREALGIHEVRQRGQRWKTFENHKNQDELYELYKLCIITQGSLRRLWQGEKRQTWIKPQRLQEKIWNYCQKKIRACLFCTVKRKKRLELDSVQTSGSNFKKEWKLC